MTLKRKRASDVFLDEVAPPLPAAQPLQKRPRNSSPPLPLTHRNLRTLERMTASKIGSEMETPSRSTPSKKTSTTVSSTDSNKSYLLLQAFNIREIAQSDPKPLNVQKLVGYVEDIRNTSEITPKSKKAAQKHRETRHHSELKAFQTLCGLLTYEDKTLEYEEEGEDLVFIGPSDQWSDCVPRPQNMDQKTLQEIYQSLGTPSKPKPDSTHGYAKYAIERAGIFADIAGLPADAIPIRNQPWFPYLVCEHKSTKTLAEARRQALKDAAAAINCAHNALRFKTGRDPSPGATAVFSFCVDSNLAELRIHWREPLPGGEIAWKAAVVGPEEDGIAVLGKEKEVFRLRGFILKILEWAKTSRWKMFVEAIGQRILAEPSLPIPASAELATPPWSLVNVNVDEAAPSSQSLASKMRRLESEHDQWIS